MARWKDGRTDGQTPTGGGAQIWHVQQHLVVRKMHIDGNNRLCAFSFWQWVVMNLLKQLTKLKTTKHCHLFPCHPFEELCQLPGYIQFIFDLGKMCILLYKSPVLAFDPFLRLSTWFIGFRSDAAVAYRRNHFSLFPVSFGRNSAHTRRWDSPLSSLFSVDRTACVFIWIDRFWAAVSLQVNSKGPSSVTRNACLKCCFDIDQSDFYIT